MHSKEPKAPSRRPEGAGPTLVRSLAGSRQVSKKQRELTVDQVKQLIEDARDAAKE
jgi:hypothetical protein